MAMSHLHQDRQSDFHVRNVAYSISHPEYQRKDAREKTFWNWDSVNSPISRNRLIEAGFFYQGNGDCTKCFICGITHRDWAEGDDPFEVHKRDSPNCPFLQMKYTKEYYDHNSSIQEQGSSPENSLEAQESQHGDSGQQTNSIEQLNKDIAIQACVEMGYDRDDVQRAVEEYMRRNGENCSLLYKARVLAEIIEEREQDGQGGGQLPEDGAVGQDSFS